MARKGASTLILRLGLRVYKRSGVGRLFKEMTAEEGSFVRLVSGVHRDCNMDG